MVRVLAILAVLSLSVTAWAGEFGSASSLLVQAPIGPSVVIPPHPIATIEFVRESGVERWEVLLRGGKWNEARVNIRITGSGCTQMGEIYPGLITPLYEGMDFKTANGKTCLVRAIEH